MFSDTAASVSKSEQVVAVGVNCLAPQDVEVCACVHASVRACKHACMQTFIMCGHLYAPHLVAGA